MSFVEQDDVIALAEDVAGRAMGLIGHEVVTRSADDYADAMRRYGSDKPDLRVDLELVECTDFFADTAFRGLSGSVRRCGGHVRRPDHHASSWTLGQDFAKQRGWQGLGPTSWSVPTVSSVARSRRTFRTPSAPAWPARRRQPRRLACSSPRVR